ncbi:MAG TPA: N-acetyltransferase [Anaerolineaceae bacterium]
MNSITIRPAVLEDHDALHALINSSAYVHRHLDWRDTLDWLGNSPFWVMEENQQIVAALACPCDPPDIAWVRLFACASWLPLQETWESLIARCIQQFTHPPRPLLASLALRDWYEHLLEHSSFQHYQDIVVLAYRPLHPIPGEKVDGIQIRQMNSADLIQVAELDHLAFEPLWQLSLTDLTQAFQRGSYCTVAEIEGKIIGYQMSSLNGLFAHLSRLAVQPDLQRRKIGTQLVNDLLLYFLEEESVWEVTVNTQNTNTSSLALYKKLGFELTGESFPVFISKLD